MTIDVTDLVEGHPEKERGGELETSLLLFLAPELVRMDEAADFLLDSQSSGKYIEGRVTTPPPGFHGIVGRPALATAEKGCRCLSPAHQHLGGGVWRAPPHRMSGKAVDILLTHTIERSTEIRCTLGLCVSRRPCIPCSSPSRAALASPDSDSSWRPWRPRRSKWTAARSSSSWATWIHKLSATKRSTELLNEVEASWDTVELPSRRKGGSS